LGIKEQETRLNLHEHDDDDEYVKILKYENIRTFNTEYTTKKTHYSLNAQKRAYGANIPVTQAAQIF
jgi:hypothetical protein